MATKPICSIPACGKPVTGHGLCPNHCRRLRLYGDPLAGRTSKGEVARFFSQTVLPYDGDECLLWPYCKTNTGYGLVRFKGEHRLAHRIVCEQENGPPPTPQYEAAHSCGKGHLGCVTRRHLSWKTRKENEDDKEMHGTRPRGEHHPLARLTEDDVRAIRRMHGKLPQKKVALLFGATRSMIYLIQSGKTWTHVL